MLNLLFIKNFFLIFFFIFVDKVFNKLIEYTLLEERKIKFDLSSAHFFNRLNVPTKFVLKTLSTSLFETSTAASAQQSIIKLYFGSFFILL